MTPKRWKRLQETLARRQPDLTVLMENVHKPHNLSAILRTCDAVGVLEAHAWVPEGKIRRHRPTSAGAAKWVRVHQHPTLRDAVGALKKTGHTVIAAHLHPDAIDFREHDYTQPTAILLGQEKTGVSSEAEELADVFVTIPMVGLVASLNVSVAAAVIMFEAQRQRAGAGMYEETRVTGEVAERVLFEWGYPEMAAVLREEGVGFPGVEPNGTVAKRFA